MTRRTKQRTIVGVTATLVVAVTGSAAWLIWYDRAARVRTRGGGALPPDFDLGMARRNAEADARRARQAVRILESSVAAYRLRAGVVPERLDDLLRKPPELDAARWDGPYVSTPKVLNDPWGRRFRYRRPGRHNPTTYDLWSTGPDAVDDTTDDIGNW